jgi:hypothetical protein
MNSAFFTGSSSSGRFISVANGPGLMLLTVMPWGASSRASARVMATRPPLLAQ